MIDTVSWTSFLSLFGIYAILSLCLNMQAGYTGMTNTGLVAFFGIGAFITAYFSMTAFISFFGLNYPIYSLDAIIAMGQISGKNPALSLGVFIASATLAFLLSGAVGYLVSYPTLRVGPAFFGITILGFGEMLRIFMKHFQPTGGTYGLYPIPNPFAWIPQPEVKSALFMTLTFAVLLIAFLYFRSLANSPLGRVLRSIREDEVASLCLGKPVPQVKARLLFVSCGICGVAGSLLAFYSGAVTPDTFITAVTFEIWTMVILGGRGNNVGALAGAAIVSVLNRATSMLNLFFASPLIEPNYVRWILMGTVIILILKYRPKGLFPEKPVETQSWNAFPPRKARVTALRKLSRRLRGLAGRVKLVLRRI